MDADDLKELFDEKLPRDFQLRSVLLLRDSYLLAHKRVSEDHAQAEAHDHYGDERRAIVEGSWRTLAGRFPGIASSVESNGNRSANHTEIRASRFVITQSALRSHNKLPRSSVFRAMQAQGMQGAFKFMDISLPSRNGPLAVILAHGAHPQDRAKLSFAFFGFPDRNYKHWYARIDLLAKFATDLETGSGVETIEENLDLTIRPPKTKEDTAT